MYFCKVYQRGTRVFDVTILPVKAFYYIRPKKHFHALPELILTKNIYQFIKYFNSLSDTKRHYRASPEVHPIIRTQFRY